MAVIDGIVIILYFVIVLVAGVMFSRMSSRNLKSYFLGDLRIPWLGLAISGSVATFDVTGTMWMVTVLYLLGMKSWWHHWMWGVMLPAFGLAYMGVWVRRSNVLTAAEWMITRFGDSTAGRTARAVYALMAVITTVAFIGYAFEGIGKFANVYVPLEQFADKVPFARHLLTEHAYKTWGVFILAFTTLYVVLGGLFGVVLTDVIQTIILTIAAIIIAYIGWSQVSPEALARAIPPGWESIKPVWRIAELHGTQNAYYEMFGFLTIAWVMKGILLNAGGPGQLYDFQRYLAARTPSDAAKLAAAWPFFLVVRWAMVAGITILALTGIASVTDPELVMPTVLNKFLPAGLRGLIIAGLLAAFMSTFSATANSGASYIVRDIWQPFIRPNASEKSLIQMSYLATILVVLIGMVIGWNAESISSIWGWLMMALGGGVIMPNVLRWHWWRINGWGYAAGVMGGIILSFLPVLKPEMPVYVSFPLICAGSLIASIVVSLLTKPTERGTLLAFYTRVKPFGFWGEIKTQAQIDEKEKAKTGEEPWRLLLNTLIAIAGITGLYLSPMYLVEHFYLQSGLWLGTALVAGVILYFTWYLKLES